MARGKHRAITGGISVAAALGAIAGCSHKFITKTLSTLWSAGLVLALLAGWPSIGHAATSATVGHTGSADLGNSLWLSWDGDRYRWEIIRRCRNLPQPRSLPANAKALVARGRYLLLHAKPQNGAQDYAAASDAFFAASLNAPCAADNYRERARALQLEFAINRKPDVAKFAAMDLHWYLEADPNAPDAAQIVRKIAVLTARAGASSDADLGWTPLVWAASFGDVATVRLLLARGAHVNARDIFFGGGMTPLGAAAANGDSAIVRLLVTHGAPIDERTPLATPLDLAAAAGKLNVVRYLIAHGADINAVDSRGYTPMMNAVFAAPYPEGPAIVKLLLSAGARTELRDKAGMTVLMLAAAYGNLDAVHDLLARGAKVNGAGGSGDTALHFAAMWNAAAMAHHLRTRPRSVEKIRCAGPPPLDFPAFQETRLWIHDPLQLPGLMAPASDLNCHCRAIFAASCAKLKIVQNLLAHQAAFDKADDRGVTPLYLAAQSGQIGIVRLLIAHGARVNITAPGDGGNTPLGVASRDGHDDVVRYLVSVGADLNTRNCQDETPLDLARRNAPADASDAVMAGRHDAATFLAVHGAISGGNAGFRPRFPRTCGHTTTLREH
jgi:ankyrin repeat protein